MRYVGLAVVAIFVMWAGFCGAQESNKTASTANTAPVAEERPDKGMTPIDTGEDQDVVKEDSGVNRENLMPPGQTYDTNTGMPNMVGSDTAGEIE